MLRVIDAGTVGAVRSQSLWHGIASAASADMAPTLSFCHPGEPYVCLGYHRAMTEIDEAACRADGLPVIRRQIGGGPVIIDEDQLFFQLTVPAGQAPRTVDRLYRSFLGPAVEAFRALGIDARLRGLNDIAVGDRKLSGTGAGQIGDAVTVVGNMIFRFPHQRMVDVLALPSDWVRRECLRLMRRHVSSLEAEGLAAITRRDAKIALERAYAEALGLDPVASELTVAELEAVEAWDRRLVDAAWTAGPAVPQRDPQPVKICADVWVFSATHRESRVGASVVEGKIEKVSVESPSLNGAGGRIEAALIGQPARAAVIEDLLEPFGPSGRLVFDLLGPALALPSTGGDGT